MTLRYYREEEAAFPAHHDLWMTPGQAAVFAERILELIGEPRATIVLPKRHRAFDRANKARRLLEFYPPRVTAAAVIHEVAHLWHDAHDALHATAVCLLVEIVRGDA